MSNSRISLDVIDIASPCTQPWETMRGDARKRFCDECKLHVYNISELTRDAAQALIESHEGRLCIRMYRRADGTVITRDCSRFRAAAKRTMRFVTTAVRVVFFAALAPFTLGTTGCCPKEDEHQVSMGDVMPLTGEIAPPPTTKPTTKPTTSPTTKPATRPTTEVIGKMRAPDQTATSLPSRASRASARVRLG